MQDPQRKAGPSVRTDELLELIRSQHARETSCLFVPCWLLLIIVTVLTGWLHAMPHVTALAEYPLSANVVGAADPATSGYPINGPEDVLPWLQGAVVPLLFPPGGGPPSALPGWTLLGGVRVTQWRAAGEACPSVAGALPAMLGLEDTCLAPDDSEPVLSGRWAEGAGRYADLPLLDVRGEVGDAYGATLYLNTSGLADAGLVRAVGCAFQPLAPSRTGSALPSWAAAMGSSTTKTLIGNGYHVVIPPKANTAPLGGTSGTGGSTGDSGSRLRRLTQDTVTTGGQDRTPVSELLDALSAGGWLSSQAVSYVRVQVTGISPTAGRWLAAAWDIRFTRGGATSVKALSISSPIDPTAPLAPGLELLFPALDAIVVAVALALTATGAWGLMQAAAVAGKALLRSVRPKAQAGTSVVPSAAGPSRTTARDNWAWVGPLLDLCCAAALWACVQARAGTITSLDDARLAVGAYLPALVRSLPSAAVGSQGTAACFADPRGDTSSATILLHGILNSAFDHDSSWRKAAGAAAALLMLKALGVLALQPRLAFLIDSVKAVAGDLSHFGLIFMILLLGHAAWAGLAFGAQAPEFGSVSTGLFALLRMSMFDYNLDPLLSQDSVGASVFYATFMLGITNIALWAWLGIALEAYSVARNAGRDRPRLPGLAKDFQYGLLNAPNAPQDFVDAIRVFIQRTGDALRPGSVQRLEDGGVQASAPGEHAGGASELTVRDDQASAGTDGEDHGPSRPSRLAMLSAHEAVLQAVLQHRHSSVFVSDVSALLGIPQAAALAVLQHYVQGDDVSTAARSRLVAAVRGAYHGGQSHEHGQVHSPAKPAQGTGQEGSSDGTSITGPGRVTSPARGMLASPLGQMTANPMQAGRGGQEDIGGHQDGDGGEHDEVWSSPTAHGRAESTTTGVNPQAAGGATVGIELPAIPSDSSLSNTLPSSPLATRHQGQYVAIRGIMVRKPGRKYSEELAEGHTPGGHTPGARPAAVSAAAESVVVASVAGVGAMQTTPGMPAPMRIRAPTEPTGADAAGLDVSASSGSSQDGPSVSAAAVHLAAPSPFVTSAEAEAVSVPDDTAFGFSRADEWK